MATIVVVGPARIVPLGDDPGLLEERVASHVHVPPVLRTIDLEAFKAAPFAPVATCTEVHVPLGFCNQMVRKVSGFPAFAFAETEAVTVAPSEAEELGVVLHAAESESAAKINERNTRSLFMTIGEELERGF